MWGAAFAHLLAERGHEVAVLDASPAVVDALSGAAAEDCAGQRSDGRIKAFSVAAGAASLAEASLIVVAVPSRAFAAAVRDLPGSSPVLILTKGLDPGSGRRLSRLIESRPVAVLSGPNFAEEIAAGLPAAAVVASEDPEIAAWIQVEASSATFRVYVNSDLAGVELCGAVKNVVALAAGAVDGLGLGDNAKAAVMTRGLAEMTRLGVACGARADTFAGLAGMGDLVATCWHAHGRNRRAGELVGRGVPPEQAAEQIGTVEGMVTAPILHELASGLGVELPITEAVCTVLSGGDVRELAVELMGRRPTEEWSATSA